MNKWLIALITIAVVSSPQFLAHADPGSDLRAFQEYFHKRFPDVPFDEFANGIYALPAAKEAREQWEQIMQFPPFEIDLEKGKQFWEENDLASCFKNRGRNIAQHYPYWDRHTEMVRTIELDINECLTRKGMEPLKDLKTGTMAQVAAYMKSLSRGQRIKINLSSPEAVEAYNEGRQFYWSKRGQLNFSCADCHVTNAGKRLGGHVLSAGLGHGVGYPAYRAKWGGLGTLHRRYAACNEQIRAAPFKPQSRQYRRLELYETYMQQGLPLMAPSQRP
ncbi:MAG: sulfur oxidation c-type cytochrome SoxA [Acidiferrobacterales bacterium]